MASAEALPPCRTPSHQVVLEAGDAGGDVHGAVDGARVARDRAAALILVIVSCEDGAHAVLEQQRLERRLLPLRLRQLDAELRRRVDRAVEADEHEGRAGAVDGREVRREPRELRRAVAEVVLR